MRATKPSARSEGYTYVRHLAPKLAVFRDSEGKLEVYAANLNHASWGFSWHGTDWEFVMSEEM